MCVRVCVCALPVVLLTRAACAQVPPGVQPGQKLKLAKRGVKNTKSGRVGSQFVTIKVRIPKCVRGRTHMRVCAHTHARVCKHTLTRSLSQGLRPVAASQGPVLAAVERPVNDGHGGEAHGGEGVSVRSGDEQDKAIHGARRLSCRRRRLAPTPRAARLPSTPQRRRGRSEQTRGCRRA